MDNYSPVTQRLEILKFAEALGNRENALRRDECGDWRISGKHGHIYAVSEGFQIFVMGWTAKGWNAAKKTLHFAKVTQDGDEEGGLIFDRLPSSEVEAALIRHWVGIAKKRDVSEETLTRLRHHGFRAGREKIDQKTASSASEVE